VPLMPKVEIVPETAPVDSSTMMKPLPTAALVTGGFSCAPVSDTFFVVAEADTPAPSPPEPPHEDRPAATTAAKAKSTPCRWIEIMAASSCRAGPALGDGQTPPRDGLFRGRMKAPR
jgi:hypothetical protein